MSHSSTNAIPKDPTDFSAPGKKLFVVAAGVGLAGIVVAVILGFMADAALRRFLFSYLVALAFFLAIGIGALFFVLLQHLTRAGWSVNVRRVAESFAMTLPVLGILTLPVLVSVAMQRGTLYPWALPMSAAVKSHDAGHGAPAVHAAKPSAKHADGEHKTLDALTLSKRPWLNPWFAILRVVAYFSIWTIIARYYWNQSTLQDADGDVVHTMLMQKYSGISILVTGITVTFASFDLLMSLDPHWFSTIFGVYFIGASAASFFAAIIIVIALLQKMGFLKVISVDHYHDLGKWLFGFVFFWGYIAFSQFMLLWYANIPETTTWLSRHGASSVANMMYASQGQIDAIPDGGEQWRSTAVLLLLGHLLIPFAGLMSRHVKRNPKVLTFWAVWVLVFHFVDMYWLVMPEMRIGFRPMLIDLACFAGVAGIVIAAWAKFAGSAKLRPVSDPRMDESLAFTNI